MLLNFDENPIVYKYRNWMEKDSRTNENYINQFSQNLIEKGELFFPKPYDLNDINECSLGYRYYPDQITKENIKKKLIQEDEKKFPHKHPFDRIIEIEELYKDTNWEELIKSSKNDYTMKIDDVANAQFRILSTSKSPLNDNMWGHYANGNTGICVGLDSKILYNLLYHITNFCPIFGDVKYQDEIPMVDFIVDSNNVSNFAEAIFFTKGTRWAKEEEIRYSIRTNIDKFLIALPKECFKEFYLGARMKEEEKYNLASQISQLYPDAKIFHIKQSSTKIGLEKEQYRLPQFMAD